MLPSTASSESQGVLGSHTGPLPGVSIDSARGHLKKILGSAAFRRSERLSRFLRFVVEQGLDGDHESLKEYSIGAEVYDRGRRFDPAIDPIVRVEARRLRATLQKYYETEGREDPLWIGIPKGRYLPQFRERRTVRGVQSPAHPPASASAIVVLPFENLSPDPESDCLCDGLTVELSNTLTRSHGFRVVALTTASALKRLHRDVREIGREFQASALVEGTLRSAGERLRITARIVNATDGYHLWSQRFDHDRKDVFAIHDEIALAVVTGLRNTAQNHSVSRASVM